MSWFISKPTSAVFSDTGQAYGEPTNSASTTIAATTTQTTPRNQHELVQFSAEFQFSQKQARAVLQSELPPKSWRVGLGCVG